MTKAIVKGERLKLDDISCGKSFHVGIQCAFADSVPDISCFGVDASGKLSDDRYFIFYNQKSSPERALQATGANGSYTELFHIDLDKLPSTIVRLVFAATLDTATDFSKLQAGACDIKHGSTTLASYTFAGKDFSAEKAIIIGEVYLKTVWRFSAVGQGFNGGLSALLKHFGGEEVVDVAPTPTPTPLSTPTSAPSSQAAQEPPTPKVNISKVRLDKQGSTHKIDLTKGEAKSFHINLQWDAVSSAPKGFFGKLLGGGGADLDLGCFWRDKQGNQGVIQPIGGNFGSKSTIPYIFLDKDDRTGAAQDGENMYILRPETIEKVLIFAMVYEGAANFRDVNARLTIRDDKGNEIFIPLATTDARRLFCAAALITNKNNALHFQKEERFFTQHKECDEFYDFGFHWVRGGK